MHDEEPNYSPTPAEFAHIVIMAGRALALAVAMSALNLWIWGLVAWGFDISCPRVPIRQGYSAMDFMGLFLASISIAFMLWRLNAADGSRFDLADEPLIVFEFLSIRISYALFGFYTVILALLATSGVLAGMAVTHYQTLRTDCFTITLPV